MPISVVKNENHIQANKTHLSANPKETLFFWFCHFIKKKPSTSYVLSTNKTTMTKYIGTVLVGHKHEHCVQMKCVSVCCRTHSPTLWTWSCKSNGMVIFFLFCSTEGWLNAGMCWLLLWWCAVKDKPNNFSRVRLFSQSYTIVQSLFCRKISQLQFWYKYVYIFLIRPNMRTLAFLPSTIKSS